MLKPFKYVLFSLQQTISMLHKLWGDLLVQIPLDERLIQYIQMVLMTQSTADKSF